MLRRWLPLCALLVLVPLAARGDFVTTFENAGLAANSFNNNAGPAGVFTLDGNRFNNGYDPTYGSWSGWALSSTIDTTTRGFENQYSAITGSGAGGSQTYAVGFPFGDSADPVHPTGSTIALAAGTVARSIAITNTTYAYNAFRYGDPYGFASEFGAGDFQRLDIQGFDAAGRSVGAVDFYLADFLNGHTTIVDTWVTVDLSRLMGATTLQFGITSSKNNQFGLATPAYFAIDNFTTAATPLVSVPEPASLALVAIGLGIGGLVSRRRMVA